MKIIMPCAFLFLPLLVSGCCYVSEQESVLSEMVDCMNEMADILETVHDKNSALLAKPKLKKLEKKLEAANARMAKSIKKGNPQEMQSLVKDYQKPLADAGQRFAKELMRVSCISGVGENFQELFVTQNSGST